MSALLANYSLLSHNTFGFAARARYAQLIETEKQLLEALADPRTVGLPRLMLGGGSNVVFTKDFDGVVWLIALHGRRLVKEDENAWWVEAGAGENWHEFVQWTLQQGWPGLENLALIPGRVGAAPIQNIGAYGLEISEHLANVCVIELATGQSQVLDVKDCQFGYRDSFFKQQGRDRFVIVSVTFRLPKKWQSRCAYAALANELAKQHIEAPTPQDIFSAVVAVRRAKLPNPSQIGNVGSFFKNPIVERSHFEALIAREPKLVAYLQEDQRVKLAAGWLIEQCAWKGRALGRAGVHAEQALVLTNLGGASGAEILKLATAIQDDVEQRFGVRLEPEPLIV